MKLLVYLFSTVFLSLLFCLSPVQKILAQTPTPIPVSDCSTFSGNIRVDPTGTPYSLLSTGPNNSASNFSTRDRCIAQDSKAIVPQFGIPDYSTIKSTFFSQVIPGTKNGKVITKTTINGDATQANITLGSAGTPSDNLYNVTGNLNLGADISGPQAGIIFVDGNLYIQTPTILGTSNGSKVGLVFIVKGNIFISGNPTITRQIDAVLVNYGTFCSSYDFSANTCPPSITVAPANQLVINGSVYFFNPDPTTKPTFNRDLSGGANSSTPAELLNYDPRYLVILKDSLSRDLVVWTEK